MSDLLEKIRSAETAIDDFLSQYGSGSIAPDQPAPDLTPLMGALEEARGALEQLPRPLAANPALRAGVDQYAGKLKLLENVLGKLRPQLEARREIAQTRLSKIQAALNWARSFSETR